MSTRQCSDAGNLERVLQIGLIHDSRHVGFQIVMQISHVLCWGGGGGGTLRKKATSGKSARRNIEIALPKVHFGIQN